MTFSSSLHPVRYTLLVWFVVLVLLLGAYQLNFLFFHTLVEIFAIVVACVIFVIAWHTRQYVDNGYLLFIGIASLFISFLDLVHALTYKGMSILPGVSANIPTQLWIGARYLQSLSFLLGLLFLERKLHAARVFCLFAAISMAILASIFIWPIFPTCYIDGVGLTPFKKISEYIISGIFAASLVVLFLRRKYLKRSVARHLGTSIGLLIFSELAFSFYMSVFDLANVIGHILKLFAFYFLYKAIIETCLSSPFDLLFKSLKENEESLKNERDFVSAILETAGALIMVVEGGRIVRFNRACELVTGYSTEEVKGIPFADLVDGQDSPFFQECIGDGATRSDRCDFSLVTKDQKRRMIAWSKTILCASANGLPVSVLTGIDITDRRMAEEQIETLNTDLAARAAELEIANEELETFSHSVSHDLRRPLTNINGFCQVIMELFPGIGNDCRGYIASIYDETLKMNSLIDTLLEFSSVARGELRKQHVDLTKMAHKVAEELRHVNQNRKVTVFVEEGLAASADPDLMRIVLENIIGNAWKYSAKKDDPLIRVWATQQNGQKVFVVEDNGAGFDMEKADRLFLPFQRLHKDFDGHGIGLATVHRIIARHGGKIWAEGAVGQGALFYFTLP